MNDGSTLYYTRQDMVPGFSVVGNCPEAIQTSGIHFLKISDTDYQNIHITTIAY